MGRVAARAADPDARAVQRIVGADDGELEPPGAQAGGFQPAGQRQQQPFEGGGHALRRADRLGIMLAHAVIRRRRQRGDALRHGSQSPVQPLQDAGGPAGRKAVGDGGAGQGHEVADRGDAEARQGLGVRVAQAQGGGGQGLQPIGLGAGGNDGMLGIAAARPGPGGARRIGDCATGDKTEIFQSVGKAS